MGTRRLALSGFSIILSAGIVALLAPDVLAVWNDAHDAGVFPKRREPGHVFVIVDTEARLVDPSSALFTLGNGTVVIDLREGPAGRTAIGRIPAGMGGGTYEVRVRLPGGVLFDVGQMEILAPPAAPEVPTIQPQMGTVGTPFTVTDPQGRMAGATVMLFTENHSDPTTGAMVRDLVVSPDGTTATGTVPSTAPVGAVVVTVHMTSPDEPPVLSGIVFQVQ
jgi:hypothetical protein